MSAPPMSKNFYVSSSANRTASWGVGQQQQSNMQYMSGGIPMTVGRTSVGPALTSSNQMKSSSSKNHHHHHEKNRHSRPPPISNNQYPSPQQQTVGADQYYQANRAYTKTRSSTVAARPPTSSPRRERANNNWWGNMLKTCTTTTGPSTGGGASRGKGFAPQDILANTCRQKRRERRTTTTTNDRGSRGTPNVEFHDRDYGRISVDSASDWDEGEANERVWGHRAGPNKERTADDLLITFRDLFPCCTHLLDKAGCCGIREPVKRTLVKQRGDRRPTTPGAKVETVCLECGNVLAARNLPASVRLDMLDRNIGNRALLAEKIIDSEKPCTYEGYKEWTVNDHHLNCRHPNKASVPLPAFKPAPTRVFQNEPGNVDYKSYGGDFYATDEGGHISLPNFPNSDTNAQSRVTPA